MELEPGRIPQLQNQKKPTDSKPNRPLRLKIAKNGEQEPGLSPAGLHNKAVMNPPAVPVTVTRVRSHCVGKALLLNT